MLKNKIIIKKIRNIFILLMAIIIMVGVYTNIRNSRAENVIQIEVEISDKSNKIDTQKITIDATETKDGNYLIKLPTSVNEFVVSKYYTTDGAEVNMINVDNSATDNTDCTLRLTETEIANKKLQLQTDYDTKEFTTDDQQTVTLYNKELKNSGISDEAENDNSKTSKTSENVQEQEENQDNVIVKGYMLPDTKAEITEVDTNTLTNVKLPDENQSLKKAYEVSTYRMVENTSAVQNETAEQSNNTEEQETVEEQASVQAENIETQQESEQAVTTEKVEYNPTEYGENLTVKIKNTEENTVATAYSLTEDGKIVDSTNVDTNTDASESAEQTSQASSATNGEYAETSVDKKETAITVVLAAEEIIGENEEGVSGDDAETGSYTATIGSGSGTENDDGQTLKEKITYSIDAENETATVNLKLANNYLKDRTLKKDDIKVFINGTETTSGITKTLSSESLTEDRAIGSTTTKSQDGVKYKLTITGFDSEVNQIKVKIPAGLVTDSNGNSNKQIDSIVYNALKSTAAETNEFLGSASNANTNIKAIIRKDIDNVKFVNSIPSSIYNKSTNEIVNTATTWDVSAQGDNSILAWFTKNSNGSYQVNIGSDYEIFGNRNSSRLFAYIGYSNKCTATETITNINLLNTSSVTSMERMFYLTGYNAMTSLDLGEKFDTSNVTYMDYMFYNTGYKAMTSLDLREKFDTSSVTSMNSMFCGAGAKAMTSLDLGDKFDTSNVTNMNEMFLSTGSTAMTSLNLGDKFDTSNVTDMSGMFEYTGKTAMTSLDLGEKFDTSSVTDMREMFYDTGYTAMTSLDLGDKFDTSSVTDMSSMFVSTGYKAMTSLDLGDKFDTSNVTNMNGMFYCTGYRAMTSLKLGNKFNTSKVTDMRKMFYDTGNTAMTSLDLGPAFTTIATGSLPNKWDSSKTEEANVDMFSSTGKDGAVIYAPEAIFQDKNNFKLNASATTAAINYTGGTINPKYRTEWVKEGTTVDTTNKNIQIKLRGRTNAEAGTDYVSDVTSSLAVGNIKILVDGTDITSIVTKTLGTATQTTNATTGAKDVLQTLTLSNFAEVTRRTGKSYKEWSGNITIDVVQKNLADKYGNKNMALTSAGARANNTIADTTKVDKNTAGSMFTDYVKPEITYVYSSGNIDQTNKTLTVDFSVVDKYFNNATFTKLSDGSYDASAIKVTLKDTNTQIPDAKITKKLTKVSDVTETRDGASVKIGEKYRLVIGGLEQVDSNGLSDGTTYSGPMSISFPEGMGVDKSNNRSLAKTITIGVNEPGGSSSDQQIVDVVSPVWTLVSKDLATGTIKVRIKDKYLGVPGTLATDKIKVFVDGTESTQIVKTITGPTQITANQEYEYTIRLSNLVPTEGSYVTFTPTEEIIGGTAKYKEENAGDVSIQIVAGVFKDKYTNSSLQSKFDIGKIDTVPPEIYDVQKTKDTTNGKATFVFNVTDKHYDPSDLITASEITLWIDGTQIDSKVTKTITKTTAIKTTINGTVTTVGHQYTLEVTLRESDSVFFASGRDYREYSGNMQVKINPSAAKDLNGNKIKESTCTISNFTDVIKPEVTNIYPRVDRNDKEYVLRFDVVDKYYDASKSTDFTIDDLTVKIDGETPDWTKVTKSFVVEERTATVNGTSKVIGKRYWIMLSNLEQVLKKDSQNYADYSGVITVSAPAGKISDTSGNKNNAITITSEVELPSGGTTNIVDAVDPVIEKGDTTVSAVGKTATIKFKATDKYFSNSTLTKDNIKVIVNGAEATSGITKTLTSTNLNEQRTVNGTTSTVKYGMEYTATITGFASDANQVKLRIPAGLVTDTSGNGNKETDLMIYNTLKKTDTETGETSGFLGNTSVQRQNVDNVTFVNNTNYTGAVHRYDAKNNTGAGHSNSTTILKDLNGSNNGLVHGGTYQNDYLQLDGVDDYVNLGKMDFSKQVTLDITITPVKIQSGNIGIIDNWENGGVGIELVNGVPQASMRIKEVNKYVIAKSSKALTAGKKTRLVATYDGSKVCLYVDGTLMASTAQTGTLMMPQSEQSVNMIIGGNQGVGKDMRVDANANINFYSANIYETALTAAQVKALDTNVWDVSAQQDGTMLAWYTQNANGTYKVYIGSDNKLFANQNSKYLFRTIGYSDKCTSTETITNLNLLNVSNVTNMYGMFEKTGFTAMTKLDLGNNFNTQSATDMTCMFYDTGNKKMTTLSLGSNFNTINVTLMQTMFCGTGYNELTSLDLGDKFDTRNVKDMIHMFKSLGYFKLQTLNLGDKFDTSNVFSMYEMFRYTGANALTSLNLGDKFDTSNVTNMYGMFSWAAHKITSFTVGNKFNTSKVTNMEAMFLGLGCDNMTSLNLGDKFDTSNVTNMREMFLYTGSNKLTGLDLGDKFNTSKVTDMYSMFGSCGSTAMTSLDLGPAFTVIPTNYISQEVTAIEGEKIAPHYAYANMFNNTGKSGTITIYAPEAIYQDKNNFKANTNTTTSVVNYTRGTINPKYRTEWIKESVTVDTTNKNIQIKLRGRTNAEAGTDYVSDVTSSLAVGNIKILVDGTDITSIVTKTLGTATQTTNATTGAKDVLQTLTLSNFAEATRRTGKSYKEWSGNIIVEVAQKTLTDTTYGNKNMSLTSAGARANNTIADTTKVDKNTAGSMFTDYVKPEITYVYSSGNIDQTNKTLTVDFSVVDKYFNNATFTKLSDGSYDASAIKVTLKDTNTQIPDAKITKKLTKVSDVNETRDGQSVKIGEKYRLVIGGLEQVDSNGLTDGSTYSGPMSIAFPAEIAVDKSNNKNAATTITIGVNEPGGSSSNQQVVDVVDPVWTKTSVDISTGTIKLRVKDKYLGVPGTLATDKIKVFVDGTESTVATKTITGPTQITANQEYEYTIKIGNITSSGGDYIEFTPIDAIIGGKAKYREESGGEISIEIAKGAISDQYGNKTAKQDFYVGYIDLIKPEVYDVQKTVDVKNDKATFVFNVTDQNYDESDLVETNELTVWMDGTQIDSKITKTITKTTAIKTTINGATRTVGHQYTLEISGLRESDTTFKSVINAGTREYRDYSGTLQIKINASAAKDKIGNTLNTNTTTLKSFADTIKPEITYKSTAYINKSEKTYRLVLEMTDKYYDADKSTQLTLDDFVIKIDNEVPDWKTNGDTSTENLSKITKSLRVEDISATMSATVPGNTNGTLQSSVTKVIGKRYTLTLSNLEQLQIKDGKNYLDYSGVFTVVVPSTVKRDGVQKGVMVDTSGNVLSTTTVTSGVELIGGEIEPEVVDVVQPFFEKINSSVDATNKTATLEFSVTDKYFKASTLTRDNIKVFINGTETTSGITKTLSSESLTEDRAIGSTTTKFQYGVKYKLTITGFASDANQVKLRIPAGLVTDSNGNSNKQTDFIVYNVLKSTATESEEFSEFLGSASNANTNIKAIRRGDIDNVKFVNSIPSSIYNKSTNEIVNTATTWDVSAQGDNSILAWFTKNSNESYQVNIGSDYEIFGNQNSSCLFGFIGSSDKCTSTETITNINLLNTSNVKSMENMFVCTGYNAMTSLDLRDEFDTSNVTNMKSMFDTTGSNEMTSLDLGDKFDTSNVTNMDSMFAYTGETEMTSLDLGEKFDTSNVTNMNRMFSYTGYSAMTSLDLGEKFDTSSVTDMSEMFRDTGYGAMTSLELGNKFNTSKVTDMREMFYMTGANAMTSLDLGPAFTKIATGSLPNKWNSSKTEEANVDMFSSTGKDGAVIYAPEAIFQDKNNFKLNASATTAAINYTGGTINPRYRTEWIKESVTVDTTNKNIQIKLRGRTNAEAGTDYVSDVTSSLAVGNIKILVDGTDITSIVTKTLGTASQTTNATTGAKDVLQTLTLSNFAEATRRTGKSYKEWSGNITIEVAQKNLADKYGNKNMSLTSAGARANNTIADTTKVDKNTAGSMFTDYVKPEITYVYSSGNIDQTNKTLTVDFSVVDKYFNNATFTKLSDGSYDASAIKVTLKDTNTQIPDAKITKKLTKVSDVTETRNGASVKIGEKYRLVIGGLEQVDSNGLSDGTTYSGPMSVTFPEGIGVDKSSNKNPSTTITIGVNEPGGSSSNQQIVDVVDPVWTKTSVDISTGTVKLRVKDKYLGVPGALDASKIKVLVNGVESTVVTKTITGPTQITANQEYEYTIKVGNITASGGGYIEFTPIDAIIGGKAKYRDENGGNISIEIAQGAISDKYGNKTKKQSFSVGNVDGTSPEVYDIQKTIDATNHKATFVFNVTDKNYDESDLVATNELTVWMDGTQIDSKITKTITKTTAIKTTINGTVTTVGHQYTLEISGLRESDATFKSILDAGTRDYRDLSGTLQIKINASAAKDKSGNTLNTATTTLKNFVDTLKPEVTYKFATSNINKDDKSFTMVFDMVDKYYNASTSTQLTTNDLTIKIDGKVPDWTKVTKSLAVTDISKTISVTDPGNTSGTIKSITKTIGKRYTLTLSNLEQLQIKQGDNYLDYSGVVTVGIPANKMADTSGNKNLATTITSGVQIPGGSGTGTVVDVVQPLVKKESSSAYAVEQTATLKFNVTDKYFEASTISESNIKVFVNGTETTSGITKKLTSTNLTEDRVSGSTTTKVQYGVDYTLTITGFVSNANQLKVRIPAGLVTDSNGNSNKQTDFIVYNALKSTAAESAETNGFLGSASSSNTGIKAIQRQNIDNVTFVNSTSGKNSNNWDVSAQGDGSILAWYTQNANGSYKVYIGSDWEMFGNYNSTNLFANVGKSSKSTSATTITNINLLNVGSVVVMETMFKNTGYNAMTKLDLGSNFNTGHATTMNQMFQGTGYTAMTILNLGDKFDTSSVTSMNQMFEFTGYTAMTSLDLGKKFDTSKVTSMYQMFYCTGYKAMTSLDLGEKFDTSSVTNMSGMFYNTGSTAMTSLDLGDKFDTSNVTDMSSMFTYTGYTAMTSLDLGDKFDTSSVTSMNYMFAYTGYTAMTSLDLGEKFDTSSVTSMKQMFNCTGEKAMASLDLGDKFDTSSVTSMDMMFYCTGEIAMTSLDLGEKFDTSSVTSMESMFHMTGYIAMTSLDLGPAFTNIASKNGRMFFNTGKSGSLTIYAPEAIYQDKTNFKLNTDATTTAVNVTTGTINAKYRTEWIKESVTVDTTNKNIQIKLRGRTNAEAGTDYVSDVTSSLAVGNIKILIDGTDITSMVTKKLGTATQTTNATTGAKDVLQTLTLSGFEQAKKIATGKSYKDWSGNITIQVAQGTLTDNTYGNKNIAVTSEGARADHTLSDTVVNKNTASTLFTDYISPSVVFRNVETVTDKTNKTYKMIFDVTDKYYDTTYADLTLNDLTIKIGGKVPSWSTSEVERKLTVSAITATVDGASKTVGKRYTLTLSKLEQLKIKDGDKYLDYSGVITVAIPAGKASDYSENKNVATTITSGIDLPEESGSDKVIDVVAPLVEKESSSAHAINQTATLKFKVTDKYFKASTITENNIKVLVNGAETTNGITKTLTSTALTEDRVSGETTTSVQYGVEYTLTVTGFASNANQVKIQIPAGLVTDNFGNGNKVTDMIVYNVLKPTYTGTYADQESKSTAPFLGNASIQRQNIDNITFVNNIPANVGYDETTKKYKNATTWDVSAQQDKSILAWYTTNANGSLKVYIGSDNEIFANQDSTDLFAYIGYSNKCTSTETITNIDLLNVTSVISMRRMFRWTGSNAMTKLDLGSKFDTSNVENMLGMFGNAGYNKMTTFSLGSKFDTSNVTDMGYMFALIGYNAMTKLDLGDKFDTSNVTDMRYMFYSTGYTVMTSLDLGDKFDTSNVTNMFRMFKSCGKEKMTSLRLGNKFNTSKVYDMNEMFIYCGYQAMTSLDLGDLFYTTNVKDMYRMFYQCGATAMTSLDLGVAFTKIPNEKITKQLSNYISWDDDKVTSYNAYDDMFTGTGKSGAVIYTPESIYKNRTSFKANSTDTITAAGTIAVSEGRTANPIYKPEWTKVSSALKPNATAPTSLEVTVKGNAKKSQTTNGVNINYNSNVTSTLSAEDIKVYINGELDGDRNGNGVIDAGETPVINISVTPGTLSNTAEATHKITLSNFEEAARQSGKSYKEWSGNISIKIGGREEATSTYTTKSLVDSYGNQSMSATDETGTWVNVLHKDADVDKNTDGKMFTDFIKPEFTYKSSNTQIIPGENGETNERIEVIFDVADKYFASTKLSSLDASQITVGIDDYDKTELNKAITKTLEKVQDLTDTVNGKTNTIIGARYRLTIKDLDKGDGYKYSGYMTLSFAAGAVTDLSGNTSNATTITVGKDQPGGTGSGTVVDVVDPIWTLASRDTDAGVIKLRVKDKYLGVPSLDTTKIKVVVNGVVSDKIVRVIAGPTAITANQEYEYTITLSNIAPVGGGYVEFTPINPIVGGTAKYREENGGAITLRIDRGAVQDKNGNTNQVQNFDIGNMDETLPEIYDVQKTKDVANNKETFIFNVTDKNYDETDYITEDEIDIIVDKYEINDKITKKMLKRVEIITTVDGKQRVVGHQYTLEVSGFKETDSTFKTAFDAGTRKYRVWSGLTQVSIHPSAAKDKSGNTINPDICVIKDFTDLIKPEVTYKYAAADINKSNKTFKMVLEVTDKYYDSANSTQLTLDDFVIKIDNEVPDWKTTGDTSAANANKINKSLSVEDISTTIPATVPGNINGTFQDSVTKVIGKRYTITLSNLEQLQIKEGDQYLDYSGIVTVAVPATVTRSGAKKNVMVDTSGNKLSATTVTSGIQLPGGSGTGTIVDVVDPLINKESSSANSATGQATLKFTATDKYFKASTLSESNIQVLVNGAVNTTVTKRLTKVKDLTETRVTNGTSSTVQVGSEYKLDITGFGAGVNQVKVKFPAGLVTDNNGNSNKETEIILYNVLKSATSESEATSGFLGSASSTNATVRAIQRQNIDNITFVNSTSSKNANVWDVSAQGDNSILAWCTKNSNGSYKVYIGSDSEIFGNRDSTQLFTYVGYSTLCTSTETITNINLLNVGSVVNMYRMFRDTGYRSMTKLDLGDNFDTSNVVYMNAMFEDTGNLEMTTLNFGSKFNTSKVTEMYRMFSYCGYTKMTSLDLSTFNTSKVTNMEGMFRDCGYTKMTNLNLGNNFDTSNVTNMTEMFNHGGRESLTTLNLGTKFNTSKVTKMNGMFCWMGALTTLNLGTNFDTSNVTDMSSMFWGTGFYNLTSLKLGDKFDTSKVTNMNSMFYDFARFKLESLDLGDKFNTKNVTNMANMFYNTGSNKMTYLDLGAQFTKIPDTNSEMFTGCGTTSLEIFAPESIYATITSFRAGN